MLSARSKNLLLRPHYHAHYCCQNTRAIPFTIVTPFWARAAVVALPDTEDGRPVVAMSSEFFIVMYGMLNVFSEYSDKKQPVLEGKVTRGCVFGEVCVYVSFFCFFHLSHELNARARPSSKSHSQQFGHRLA